jgi:iron complex outermembrane receptor protein
VNHGRSELDFHEKETINISYWYEPKPGGGIYNESPFEADTGVLKFRQTTVNLDLRGPLNIGGREISFATGFEYRRDGLCHRRRRSGLLPVRPHQQPGDRDP